MVGDDPGAAPKEAAPSFGGADFVWTQTHGLAAEKLGFAIRSRLPVILMIGADGGGKTRLAREVVEHGPEDRQVLFIADPAALGDDPERYIRTVMPEVPAAPVNGGPGLPVLVIDDAHRLDPATLVRLVDLAEPETGAPGSLRLVLIGPRALSDTLSAVRPHAVGPMIDLPELGKADIETFVRALMRQPGNDKSPPDKEEMERIAKMSLGNPRRILRLLGRRGVDEAAATPARGPDRAGPSVRSGGAATAKARLFHPLVVVAGLSLLGMLGVGGAYTYFGLGGMAPPAMAPPIPADRAARDLAQRPVAVPPAPQGETAAPRALIAPVQAIPPSTDTARLFYRAGVELAARDSAASVAAFAHAALLGHEKAAYFLGQMYQTGEGVPRNEVLARAWYASIADSMPRAAQALAALPLVDAAPRSDTAPAVLHAELRGSAQFVVVWSDAAVVPGARYAVEFADRNRAILETVTATVPALRLRTHFAADAFRVVRSLGDARHASDWFVVPKLVNR